MLAALRPLALLLVISLAACSATAPAGSIGAILGRDTDTRALYVRDVPEGLGASLAGLIPGDEILMINGQYTRDLDQKAIVKLLRGEIGTEVDLTVARGGEVRHVRVKRTALRETEVKPKEETIEP